MIESGPNTMISPWESFNQAVRDSNLAREKFSLDAISRRFTSSLSREVDEAGYDSSGQEINSGT